jgi:hypothetical protein
VPARLILAALRFFAAAAALGAVFALLAPISFMRGLGLVALGVGLAGCALELYALHSFDPAAYAALGERWRAFVHRLTSTPVQPAAG